MTTLRSELLRDLYEPGWREREMEHNLKFLRAIPSEDTVDRVSAVAAERERCAKIAEAGIDGTSAAYADACRTIAALIRAA